MAERLAFGIAEPKVKYWAEEIDDYERLTDKWLRRARKILRRYKDIRTPREEAITRFNVFWANVKIRLPALYARNPKAVVERRYRDKDPVGRVTSEILERGIQFTLDSTNDSKLIHRQAILDYELVGRGTTWVRYVPHLEHKPRRDAGERDGRGEETPPSEAQEQSTGPSLGGASSEPAPMPAHDPDSEVAAQGPGISSDADSEYLEDELTYEEVKLDYVQWEDFGHNWCRTWQEIRGVWKKVFLDRDELLERFAKPAGRLTRKQIMEIPLDYAPRTLQDAKVPVTRKKAVVYEIWDRKLGEIVWLVKNFPLALDVREDEEKLKDFFPCPRPLLANNANDDMVPVPNIVHYQDQANEVDELSSRITSITKALKVAGVRDTSAEGLDRLLSEGVENQLIPVEGWAVHKEKGGLKGVYELLPMAEIAETLGYLREQRKEVIEDIYQLTGISDIVRGLSDPNETATAQQLKGQFSVLRIQEDQMEVQRFCRDEVHIIGEMLAKCSIETLKAISGVKLLTAREKAEIQQQLALQQRIAALQSQAAQAAGPQQGPGAPPGAAPGAQPPPHPPMPGAPPAQPGAGGAAPPPGGAGLAHPMSQGPAPQGAPGAAPGQPAPMGGGMNPAAPAAPMTPQPGQAPVSPDKMQLLELPTWEDVEALLRNPVQREFRLDIETDSTIRMDEETEKKSRIELMTAVGQYMQQAMEAGASAPEIVPMLAELLMFVVRAFSTAREVEQTFDDMMEALEQAAKQPRPNPEVMKEQARVQGDLQIAQGKAKVEADSRQAILQAETAAKAREQQMEEQRQERERQGQMQLEQWKAELKAQTEERIEHLRNQYETQRLHIEAGHKERLAVIEHRLGMISDRQTQAHETRMGRQQIGAQSAAARTKGANGGSKGRAAA